MKITDIYTYLSELYSESLRLDWDNDGIMLCPDTNAEISGVLTALDVTDEAISEAERLGFNLILTHHPLIFHKLSSLDAEKPHEALIIKLIKKDISVISLHTRFDRGANGLNDGLCAALGFSPHGVFGLAEDGFSLGRIVTSDRKVSGCELAHDVASRLNAGVRLFDAGRPIQKIGLVSGGGKDYIAAAAKAGLDAFISGDISHDAAVAAREYGLTVIDAGHCATERICTGIFKEALDKLSPRLKTAQFSQDLCGEFVL